MATSAKGYAVEAGGHVTIVVDRAAGMLVGAAIAGPRCERSDPRGRPRDPGAGAGDGARGHDPRVPDDRAGDGRAVHEGRQPPAGRVGRSTPTGRAPRGPRRGRGRGGSTRADLRAHAASSSGRAGITIRSARAPATSRPPVGSPAIRAGPTVDARRAVARSMRLVRPERPPARPTRRRGGSPRARCRATDRPVRPVRRSRTRRRRRPRAGTGCGTPSRSDRARPQWSNAFPRSVRRWIGWIEAAMPRAGEPRQVFGPRQLDVLDATHRARVGSSRPVVSSTSSAVRSAASPIAWIWGTMPAAIARPASAAQFVPIGDRDAAIVGPDVWLDEQRGPRPQRAVGEELQPTHPGMAVRIVAQWFAGAAAAARSPRRDRAAARSGGRGSPAARCRRAARSRPRRGPACRGRPDRGRR